MVLMDYVVVGSHESALCHVWFSVMCKVQKSMMCLREESLVQGSGEVSVLCCLCSFPSSLALVNGCTLWPQPGALGSVVNVAVATGLMSGKNTPTNSPLEPYL